MSRDQSRIIELQRQVRIAKTALETIAGYDCPHPHSVAEEALENMRALDKPVSLDGILGWSRRP